MSSNMQQPEVTASPLRETMRKARQGFILAAVVSAFLNILMLTSPIYMLQVFDRVLTTGHTDTLVALSVIVFVALAVLGLLEGIRLLLLSRTAAWVTGSLGPTALSAVLTAEVREKHSSSCTAMRDLSTIQSFAGSTNLNPFFDAPWTPVFIVFIFLLHPLLGWLALATAALLLAIAFITDRWSRPALEKAASGQATAHSFIEEALRNAEATRAMGLAPRLKELWGVVNASAATASDVGTQRMAITLATSRFIRFGAQAAVLGLGAALVISGNLSPGGMIAGSILLGRALAPVDQAIGSWRTYVSARQAYCSLSAALDDKPGQASRMQLPEPAGHLTAESISYSHTGSEHPTINAMTLDARPGELLALIGPSAAGKSTLCRLLVGAYRPESGHVRLDGADLSAWNPEDLGPHIGYLPQDVELFSGTIRHNIARLNEGEPDAVIAAAQAAGIHDMVLRLPEGYDTQIGPMGSTLSGGQRQRVALARALYKLPKLIVLDEPNASLDNAGDNALETAIKDAKAKGSTIIVASHRRQLVDMADKVALIDAGRIRAFGPRGQVLKSLEQNSVRRAQAQLVQQGATVSKPRAVSNG